MKTEKQWNTLFQVTIRLKTVFCIEKTGKKNFLKKFIEPNIRFICIVYVFLCVVYAVQSQTYSSVKLSEIGEYLPAKCLPPTDSIFDCRQIISGKSLSIKYNSKKEIEHLGVSLFSPEMKEMINLPVCNFIERFLLELLLQKTTAAITQRLDEYSVSIEGKNIGGQKSIHSVQSISAVLNKMQGTVKFLLQQEGTNYTAIWELPNNEIFTITFPASRELIFGTNKKESDRKLGELLTESHCSKIKNETYRITPDDVKPASFDKAVFERRGSFFMLPKLNSDKYYYCDADKNFYPLNADNYPAVSLKNLLLIPQLNTTLRLHLTHRQYGNFTPEFDIKLCDFICFFQSGFDSYCHVENPESGVLQATIILHNKAFNYIHLLNITTDTGTIFQENGILNAELYSNIPQHNIKNLFQTQ